MESAPRRTNMQAVPPQSSANCMQYANAGKQVCLRSLWGAHRIAASRNDFLNSRVSQGRDACVRNHAHIGALWRGQGNVHRRVRRFTAVRRPTTASESQMDAIHDA